MHALSCSIDALVITRQNEIYNKLLYLPQRAFTSASIRSEPLIHQGRTRSEQEIHQGSEEEKETRGDALVQGLWYCQVDAIIDIKLGDADADSYNYEPMTVLLARWETIKKDKHCKHCNDEQKHFSPVLISVDGMLGR